jgi:hypothetical protein
MSGTVEIMCGRCGEVADRPRPPDIPAEVRRVVTPCPDCADGYLLPEMWVTDDHDGLRPPEPAVAVSVRQ